MGKKKKTPNSESFREQGLQSATFKSENSATITDN